MTPSQHHQPLLVKLKTPDQKIQCVQTVSADAENSANVCISYSKLGDCSGLPEAYRNMDRLCMKSYLNVLKENSDSQTHFTPVRFSHRKCTVR